MLQNTKSFSSGTLSSGLSSLILSVLVLPLFLACTPTVAQRGNMVQDYQLEELSIGTSSRSDVLRALGSPTTKSTFNALVWYYIGQETEKRGIFDPEVVEENIVLVAFTDEGVLEALRPIDRERMSIPYAREKTPTHGNDTTIAKEFLGNLGKFNAPAQ